MPLPIWPAPTTPILRTELAIVLVCSLRAFGRSLTSTISIHLLRRSRPSRQFRSALNLIELGCEFRQGRIEIGHQAVIGDLEDRGFIILVDRHDHLGILHAGKML